MKLVKVLFLIIIVSSVIGCGGGGGGGNDDPVITGNPVWNAGIGFVCGSNTKIGAASSKVSDVSLQEISLKELLVTQSFNRSVVPVESIYKNTGFKAADIDSEVWSSNIRFIFLDWNTLRGATYYKVYFLGTDGSQNMQVWDSRSDHPGDPSYLTKAFLDVTGEFANNGITITPDSYQFKVIAYNSRYSKEYPVITVSIGKQLSSIPTGLAADATARTLSWTGVSEAKGYKAVICSENFKTLYWNSGGTYLVHPPPVPVAFPVIGPRKYSWVVYAYYTDSSGRIIEISYATSGFTIL